MGIFSYANSSVMVTTCIAGLGLPVVFMHYLILTVLKKVNFLSGSKPPLMAYKNSVLVV